jgi:hypothetical protein
LLLLWIIRVYSAGVILSLLTTVLVRLAVKGVIVSVLVIESSLIDISATIIAGAAIVLASLVCTVLGRIIVASLLVGRIVLVARRAITPVSERRAS